LLRAVSLSNGRWTFSDRLLAKYLKLTEVTIYKYVKEGKIPTRRIGSRWRFDKDQIGELLRKGEEGNQ
jgi:excisionase family DNA binding protein